MKLVQRNLIKFNKNEFLAFDKLAFLSKNLYNCAVYLNRQAFFSHQPFLTMTELHHALKTSADYQALPAKVSQLVLKQVEKNFKSYQKAQEQFKKSPNKFTIENVVWVSDRGILTNSKINELVKPIVRIRLYYFRTLLEDLGTICLNTVECTIREGSYRFAKITPPTQLQQSCVRFIRVVLDLYPVKGQPKFS